MDLIFLSVRESILSMNSELFFSIVNIISAKILAIATIALFLPTLLTMLRYLDLSFFYLLTEMCDAFTRMNLSIEGPLFDIWPLISLLPD